MLIIRYRNRVFFIHQLYVDGLIIVSGLAVGYTIKYFIQKYHKPTSNLNQSKPKIQKIRGGDTHVARIIRDCMEKDGLYEITNPRIVKMAQYVFNTKRKNLVMHIASFVMVHIISNKAKHLIETDIVSVILLMTNLEKIKSWIQFGSAALWMLAPIIGQVVPGIGIATSIALQIATMTPFSCEKEVIFLSPSVDQQIYIRSLPSPINRNGNRVFVNVQTPLELKSKQSRELALEQGTKEAITNEMKIIDKITTPKVVEDIKNLTKVPKKISPSKIYYPRTLGNSGKGGKKDAVYNKAYANFDLGRTYFEKRPSLSLDPYILVDPIEARKDYVRMTKRNTKVTDLYDLKRNDDTESCTEFEIVVNNMCPLNKQRIRLATDQYDESDQYCE
jgi:hypothetical protein